MANSYTYCSREGIQAVVDRLPDRYNMNLNRSDMEMLILALSSYYNGEDAMKLNVGLVTSFPRSLRR